MPPNNNNRSVRNKKKHSTFRNTIQKPINNDNKKKFCRAIKDNDVKV